MYTTKLAVVNACLATMGEAPLNSLNDTHVYKQAAINYLDGSTLATLKRGLWFNVEAMTLQPVADSGYLYVPGDVIHIARIEGEPVFQERGNRLYDPYTNSYSWSQSLRVVLVRRLDFEDCPYFAQDAISLDAILRFQREYDGDAGRYNQLDRDRQRANIELNAQHIREIKVNLLFTNANLLKLSQVAPTRDYAGPRLGLPGRN